jgi:hypothetical protein
MSDRDAWPVFWSPLWVGGLAALAVGLLVGLVGFAVGAHQAAQIVDWKKVHLLAAVFNIAGAFFAFVVGGWVAVRLAGFRRAEPAVLHGAMVWLLTVPFLLLLSALGGAAHFGWFGGLASPLNVSATLAQDPQFAVVMRNTALAAATALLVGLVGAALGGWMGSGEPMTFGYYRRRDRGTAIDPRGRERVART